MCWSHGENSTTAAPNRINICWTKGVVNPNAGISVAAASSLAAISSGAMCRTRRSRVRTLVYCERLQGLIEYTSKAPPDLGLIWCSYRRQADKSHLGYPHWQRLHLHHPGASRCACHACRSNSVDLYPFYSILAHPVVSVFYQLSPKQQKYQNFPYKKAVLKWPR